MKTLNRFTAVLITAAVAIVGIAYAAQPPDVVVSDGSSNTAMGSQALLNLTSGSDNTAAGDAALGSNTSGRYNTAVGSSSLFNNSGGSTNTAVGYAALLNSQSGSANTAVGSGALASGGSAPAKNTAVGVLALASTGGTDNAGIGWEALKANTTGVWNTASGSRALHNNTSGKDNTGTGFAVLDSNTTGDANTASGSRAMFFNTTGINNVALGYTALYQNVSGFRNVALGYQAGLLVTGSDNITVGGDNQGKAAENGVIRIGNKTYQKKTFIAGIKGVTTGLTAASAVFVDGNGQLGTIKSSARFKEDIHPMGNVSERLFALRPVTFRYKQADEDGSKPVQFGLIAEEVAKAFPELVIYDDEGKPESVSYHLLATLILNEFQKEHSLTQAQATRIAALEDQSAEVAQLKMQVARMAEVIERLDHERVFATNH